ncbi:MAG: hypothetical protein E3K32_13355 [wastewater metagenome]|nr:hypothetical protein [Candidatus Loosdrechtia aerotolerans]
MGEMSEEEKEVIKKKTHEVFKHSIGHWRDSFGAIQYVVESLENYLEIGELTEQLGGDDPDKCKRSACIRSLLDDLACYTKKLREDLEAFWLGEAKGSEKKYPCNLISLKQGVGGR